MATPDPGSVALEGRALKASAAGALLIGCVGVFFAAIADSRAILLDGLFNVTYSVVGLVTLKVSHLVTLGEDEEFPAGYAYFEPLINGFKGVIILGVSLMAFFEAVGSVLEGGRMIEAGRAMGYGVFAVVACTALALYTRRGARRTGSPLVEADARNWIVNGAISGGVLAAFVLVFLLRGTRFAPWLPYVDPGLVLVVIAFSISVPVRMSWSALLELINRTPSPGLLAEVRATVEEKVAHLPVQRLWVRVLQPGRTRMVMAHVVLPPDHTVVPLSGLDAIRAETLAALEASHRPVVLDMVFTSDPTWGELKPRAEQGGGRDGGAG